MESQEESENRLCGKSTDREVEDWNGKVREFNTRPIQESTQFGLYC
jgi:hypothetical protein